LTELGHGQVWWVDLPGDKIRPVVVLTRRRVAPLLRQLLVAPVTSTIRNLATEVRLGTDEGLSEPCVANLDNCQLVPTDYFLEQAGEVGDHRWREFCAAMDRVMSCQPR
jgi:mRNA interferase MazF